MSLFFVIFCYFTLLIILTKIILLLFFFMKILFIFSCSGMFRNVPECFGMFHVPGFIDAHFVESIRKNFVLTDGTGSL